MKAKIVLAIIGILVLAAVCFSAEIGPSSEKTADAVIVSPPMSGQYGGMVVITDGTNNCTVKVTDNGRVLDDGICVGSTVTCKYLFPWPVQFTNDITVDITTSGTCTYIIYYK